MSALLIDLNTGEIECADIPALELAIMAHAARHTRPWTEELITSDDDHVGIRDLVICRDANSAFARSMARYAECVRARGGIDHV